MSVRSAPPGGAIVVALRLEALALRRRTGHVPVLRTGMGPRRVAGAASHLARYPGWMSAGLCGGLAEGVRPGDLVVATEVVDGPHRLPVRGADALAQRLRRPGVRVLTGPLAAGAAVVHGAARTRLARNGALAVDMESGALSALAGAKPFAAVRVVVDTADAPLLRPGTPLRVFRALRNLRRSGPALAAWAGAVGSEPTTDTVGAPKEVA